MHFDGRNVFRHCEVPIDFCAGNPKKRLLISMRRRKVTQRGRDENLNVANVQCCRNRPTD